MNSEHGYLISFFLILLYITSKASALCNRFCGQNKTQQFHHLPYPFGFSPDCEIQLNCSTTGEVYIQLQEFQIKNITSDNLILQLPANCNRSLETMSHLYNKNYAITSQNVILLTDCGNDKVNQCMFSTGAMKKHFQGCSQPISCYSQESGFVTLGNVNRSGCNLLLSSVAYDELSSSSSIAFESQRVNLGWWLEGNCKCSDHANCTNFISPFNRQPGFRCRCIDGFVGDGFVNGNGCRKVSSKCNPSKYMSGQCGGNNRVGVLIGGIIVGACLMSGLALLCFLIQRKSSSLKSRKSARHLLAEAAGDCSIPFYSYKEIERATSCFSDRHRIGTGAYGTVYAGKLHSDEWAAIKKIRHREADGIEQVMNEIKLLSSVSHPNLVRLLGCCIEGGEQILVYEFMPNGTLSQHLQRERGSGLSWTVRLNIATETAQAIAHLHSAQNPIYHRDIKSSNILLDYNFKSKVADFGLSRLGMTETSHISTAPQGTPGYLDPQYHQNFHLSDKSDVYSFGVVLAEIITALKVVDFSRAHSEVNLAALAVEKIGKGCVDEIMDPYLDPHSDAWTLSSVHKVAELAFRCLAFHRDMRPSMVEVAAELECIRLSSWGPSEENECLASSPSVGSEKSQGFTLKKVGIDSRRLVLPLKGTLMIPLEELKDSSPVSVQEIWYSEQSSPSSTSLLDNAIN